MKTFTVTEPGTAPVALADLNTTIGLSETIDLLDTGYSIDKLNESQDLADAITSGTLTADYNGSPIFNADPTAAAQAISGGEVGLSLARDLSNLDSLSPVAQVDNLALPTGGVGYKITMTSSEVITGIAAGTDGQLLMIRIVGSGNLQFRDTNANSLAGNRFASPDNADKTLKENSTFYISYDASLDSGNGAWHLIIPAL